MCAHTNRSVSRPAACCNRLFSPGFGGLREERGLAVHGSLDRSGSGQGDPVSTMSLLTFPPRRNHSLSLTAHGTAFVGRARELEQLEATHAGGQRLTTIVGAGGMGKTRLALEFARGQIDVYEAEGGVWFCDLAQARTLDDALAAIARTLDVPLESVHSSEQGVERIGDALAARARLYLVLDNFERLAQLADSAIETWLAMAEELRILVTSRERLRIAGELVIDVQPLGVPEGDAEPAEVREAEAVRLFADRATLSRTDFELTDQNLSDIAELVRRLDGMPLAIELCAARIEVMDPAQLERLISKRFDVLVSSERGRSDRHATLRKAIDWSWEMLGPMQQRALAECSVFRGGFSLDAAASVLGELTRPSSAQDPSLAAMDVLQALHARSLVRSYDAADRAGGRRFGLLESVRDYAREKLDELGGAAECHARHAAHYIGEAQRKRTHLRDVGEPAARAWLAAETDNLIAIVERSGAVGGQRSVPPVDGLRAVLALEPVIVAQGPIDRVVRLLELAIANAEVDASADAERARAIELLAYMKHLQSRHEEAMALFDAAIAIATRVEAFDVVGAAESRRGLLLAYLGRIDDARACFERARSIRERHVPGPIERALALRQESYLWARAGEPERSRRLLESAIPLFRDVGARREEGIALSNLALRFIELGRVPEARDAAKQAIDALSLVRDRRWLGSTLVAVGFCELEAGELDKARESFLRARRIARRVGERGAEAFSEGGLGDISLEESELEAAVEHYTAAIRLFEGTGVAYTGLRRAGLAVARSRLGDIELAERQFDEIVERVDAAGVRADAEAVRVLRGHVLLDKALRALEDDDAAGAERLIAGVRAIVDPVRERMKDANALPSDEVRFAFRTLERRLDSMRPDRRLTVAADGSWFIPPSGERVEVGTRKALRALLRAFAEARQGDDVRVLDQDALVSAAWPGERIRHQAASNRLKVALSTLRSIGLRDVLETCEDGYRIDTKVDVIIAHRSKL